MAQYAPKQKYLKTPIRVAIYDGKKFVKWVGIGGEIEIKRQPPKLSEKVKAATQTEMKQFHENGFENLFDVQDKKTTTK